MALVDYFLKLDGIEGESKDSKHKDEIDLETFSWGAAQRGISGSGGGGGAGKVQLQDFHFVMKTNKSSPKLFLACCTGEHIKKAVLTVRKAGKDQQEYLKITLSDLIVSKFEAGAGGNGENVIPTEQVQLNFSKIEIEYKEQKADGSLAGAIKSGYDVKENKKV